MLSYKSLLANFDNVPPKKIKLSNSKLQTVTNFQLPSVKKREELIIWYPHKNKKLQSETLPRKMGTVIFFQEFSNDEKKKSKRLKRAEPEKYFTLTVEGSFVCQRIGEKPDEPTLLLLVEGNKSFVLELGDRESIYGDISTNQARRVRAKYRKSVTKEQRLHHIATRIAGVSKAHTNFYLLETWNKMTDEFKGLRPTPTVKASTGSKKLYNAVAHTLETLKQKNEALEMLGTEATSQDHALISPLLTELEGQLTSLYCLSWDKYKTAFQAELLPYKAQKVAAIRAKLAQKKKPAPVPIDNSYEQFKISSKIDSVQSEVNEQEKEMSTSQSKAVDLACQMLCDPEGSFALSLLPHVVTVEDLKTALVSEHLATDTVNVSGMALFLRSMCWSLQMLVACRPTKNEHHKNASSSGWLNGMVRKLSSHQIGLRNAKTHDSASMLIQLTFAKAAGKKNKQWIPFFDALKEYVAENMPENSHDIRSKLNKMLEPYGGFTNSDPTKACKTNIGKWKIPKEQKTILMNLSWLWLLAEETVAFDGSVEDFCVIYLESSFGDSLIRAFCAYRSCITKLLGDAIKLPGFVNPPIAITKRAKREKQTDKLVFGADVLEGCINYVWTRVQLEWPIVPTNLLERVAKARMVVFVFIWAIVEKYSTRVHNIDKLHVVTPQQKLARHPNNWGGRELEAGITVVAGPYNVSIELLDTKRVQADSDGKRNGELYEKNFFSENIVVAGHWQPGFGWFRTLWSDFKWAVSILAPTGRYYTSSIYDMQQKKFKEIPMHTIPLPTSPIETKEMLQIDQSKFPGCKSYIELHSKAQDALARCNGKANDFYQHGVRLCSFPSQPSAKDFTPCNIKTPATSTSSFHADMMQEFIRTFGTSFEMKSQGAKLNWRLSVYNSKTKKRIRGKNNGHAFQPLQSMNDLIGLPKLFGGNWTQEDLSTLSTLSKGIQNGELIYDLKQARHSTIAMYYAFGDVMSHFLSKKDHAILTCWEELRQAVKKREVHHEDTTNKVGYCKQMVLYDVCKPSKWLTQCVVGKETSYLLRRMIWAHPIMKDTDGNYHKDAIQLGSAVPFKHWPTSLVDSVKPDSDHRPVLVRCSQFEMLTVHEQIELLWTLRAARTFLEYLHEKFQLYSTDAGLQSLRAFVNNICTAPSDDDDIVMSSSSSSSSSIDSKEF